MNDIETFIRLKYRMSGRMRDYLRLFPIDIIESLLAIICQKYTHKFVNFDDKCYFISLYVDNNRENLLKLLVEIHNNG